MDVDRFNKNTVSNKKRIDIQKNVDTKPIREIGFWLFYFNENLEIWMRHTGRHHSFISKDWFQLLIFFNSFSRRKAKHDLISRLKSSSSFFVSKHLLLRQSSDFRLEKILVYHPLHTPSQQIQTQSCRYQILVLAPRAHEALVNARVSAQRDFVNFTMVQYGRAGHCKEFSVYHLKAPM